LSRIAREEGIKGLWDWLPFQTIFRAMSLNSSQLVSYNEAKERLMHAMGEKKGNHDNQTDSFCHFQVSQSSIISLPFDNVKTKFMRMKKNKDGVFAIFRFLLIASPSQSKTKEF
jgi:solute carrier family 25 oxoglutarate transporter 11